MRNTSFSGRPAFFRRTVLASLVFTLSPGLLFAAEGLQDVAMTHEVTRLLLQLGIIILAAKAGGSAAKRLGLPAL